MNVDELNVADLGGLDEAKFREWKMLRLGQKRQYRVAGLLLAPVVLVPRFLVPTGSPVSTLIRIAIILPVPIALGFLVSALAKSKRINQIDKEIGITKLLSAKKKAWSRGGMK